MSFIFLVKLSENDKRVMIALLLVFILLLLILGYIFMLIKHLIKKQGDAVDTYMYDIMRAKLVNSPKEFRKISFEKSLRKFYFQARIPFLIMVVSLAMVFIYQLLTETASWNFIFNNISDLFFKFGPWPTTKLFGITLPSDWPEVIKNPELHFTADGIISYIFLVSMSYGIIHYMFIVLGLISRNYRTRVIAHDFFKKDLKKLKEVQEVAETDKDQKKIEQAKLEDLK